MRHKGVLKDMPYPKTIEIKIEDVSDLQQIMYLYLVEKGVFNLATLTKEQHTKLINPVHRLTFIKEFVDTFIYANSLWQYTNVHTYDSYLEPVYERYQKEEFEGLNISSINLQEVFSCMETDIINALPEKLLQKTWNVWCVSLVAQSLVFRNEGDYRILTFAKDVLENKDNPFHGKVSKGTLYRHDKP